MPTNDQFDPLDELLAKAQWPEMDAESTSRLRKQWISMRFRSVWIGLGRIAIAAVLLIAISIIWMLQDFKPEKTEMATWAPSPMSVQFASADRGRPPTMVELAILRVSSKQGGLQKSQVPMPVVGVPLVPLVTAWPVQAVASQHAATAVVAAAAPEQVRFLLQRASAVHLTPRQRTQAINELIAQGPSKPDDILAELLANPVTAPTTIAALTRNAGMWTEALFASLSDPRIAVRQAAGNALARIDGPVITTRLAVMANEGVNTREAIAALAQIHSEQSKKYLAFAATSPALAAIAQSAIAQNRDAQPQTGEIQ